MSFRDFPPPTNYQAIYQGDVWNVFHSLGQGYGAFLIKGGSGLKVWMIHPKGTTYSDYYKDEQIIRELIDKQLAQKQEQLPPNHPIQAKESYELTEKGRELFNELGDLSFAEGARIFIERVRPVKRKTAS